MGRRFFAKNGAMGSLACEICMKDSLGIFEMG